MFPSLIMANYSLNEEITQFRDTLLKMKRNSAKSDQDSKNIENKVAEGKLIVLKGSPKLVLILYSIFLIGLIGVELIYFDLQTSIILLSVWLGTGVIYFTALKSLLLILHPEGFLLRRYILFKYSQKWENLISPPSIEKVIDSEGGAWYNLKLTGPWEVKRINAAYLKIRDIKNKEEKMNFIGKIMLIYYERASLS